GFNVAKAEGEYRGETEGNIDITITDMGNMSGLTAMAAGWAMVDLDKETDTGYEKTTTYNGQKAHEQYNREGHHGEISVLVANRFIVEVKGNSVTMDNIKSALGKIDIGKLDGMKMQGVQP